jgi:hypothetical protein
MHRHLYQLTEEESHMVQTAWSQALNGNLTSDELSYSPEGVRLPSSTPQHAFQ